MPKTITIAANTIAKDIPTNPTWKYSLPKGTIAKVLAIAPNKTASHFKVTIDGNWDGRNTVYLFEGHVLFANEGATSKEGAIAPGTFRLNSIAKQVIKEFEGMELTSYKCPADIWTIGIGSTLIDGEPVQPEMRITEEKAWEIFSKDCDRFISALNSLVKTTLTGKQVAALTSFIYNCGEGAFEDSTLLKVINAGGSHAAIAEQLQRWTNGGLAGLVRRREEECRLWKGK